MWMINCSHYILEVWQAVKMWTRINAVQLSLKFLVFLNSNGGLD